MKQWWKKGIFVCILLILAFPALTARGEAGDTPEELNQLYAQSAVLMDAGSGRILFEKNGQEVRPMASTTKIMTLIVTLENADLNSVVTISGYAAGMPDVQLNARKGEQYRLEDLLCSLMLESHNDSAVAIAEHVAAGMYGRENIQEVGQTEGRAAGETLGPEEPSNAQKSTDNAMEQGGIAAEAAGKDASLRTKEESRALVKEFAALMNAKARDMGCFDTHFVTPNGLDGEDEGGAHATTAADLAGILRYCITQSPQKEQFLEITRRSSHSFTDQKGSRSFTVNNHNAFLQMMEGALTGKTGFTSQAGYCYVGALERDGKTYIAALLACGWPNHKSYKWSDMRKLMNYGLEHYDFHPFSEAGPDPDALSPIPVLGGRGEDIGEMVCTEVEVAQEAALSSSPQGILLRADESIQVEYQVKEQLEAPVEKGAPVGSVRYLVNNEVFKTELLVAGDNVSRIDFKWCLKRVVEMYL